MTAATFPPARPAPTSRRRTFHHRILFHYPHQHLHSGSPRALLSVIDGLDRDRFTPLFLSCGDGPLIDELSDRGVDVVHQAPGELSPRSPRASLARLREMSRILERHRIDLIHVHEFGWNSALVAAAAWRGTPVVLHVHNPASAALRNLNWRLADRIVFVSRSHLTSTERIDRIARKSGVIYNSADISRFARGKSIRARLGLAPTDIAVVTVAQLSRRKGLDILLDAAERLLPRHQDLRFIVIGAPAVNETEFVREITERAGTHPLAGNVRFLGPRSDIPDVLASGDLFCLPTRAEPLGIVIIEAMAAGLPVVASAVGGIPEMIVSPRLGLLAAPESAAVADQIERVLGMPDRGAAMGRAAAASLPGRFDPGTVSEQWDRLYSGLIAGRR